MCQNCTSRRGECNLAHFSNITSNINKNKNNNINIIKRNIRVEISKYIEISEYIPGVPKKTIPSLISCKRKTYKSYFTKIKTIVFTND